MRESNRYDTHRTYNDDASEENECILVEDILCNLHCIQQVCTDGAESSAETLLQYNIIFELQLQRNSHENNFYRIQVNRIVFGVARLNCIHNSPARAVMQWKRSGPQYSF